MGIFKKVISWYLVAAMLVIGLVPQAYASFVPSEKSALPSMGRSSDLQQIQKTLELKMVQDRLAQLGFTPEEISVRLNQLDDQQLHQLAQNLDELKVGGSFWGWVLGIAIVAVIVWLVLRFTGILR